MPVIFLLLFASIQAAAWFLARATALNAAHEAVNAQRVYQAPPGVGVARAEDFLGRAGDWLNGATVSVTASGANATVVSATVQGQPLRVIPWIPLPAVSETVHGTVERFTPENAP
jgi:hypothetical protein